MAKLVIVLRIRIVSSKPLTQSTARDPTEPDVRTPRERLLSQTRERKGKCLTDALQLATTQLVSWLETDYKLTPNEAAVVAGTALRYGIAEIVDPLVHVVAKIPKEAVAKLK